MKFEEIYTNKAIEELNEMQLYVPSKEEFTCNKCPAADDCAFAWDLYNTNGDCLADK